MPSIQEAITDVSSKRDALRAQFSERVFDTVLPQVSPSATAYPALVFTQLASPPLRHSVGEEASHETVVKFETYALDASKRRVAAQTVNTVMTVWSGSYGGLVITSSKCEANFDGVEDIGDGGPLPVFKNTQIWRFRVREPAAVSL